MASEGFSSAPVKLIPVTNPDRLEEIYRKTGLYPLPEAEREWVEQEGCKRLKAGIPCSTDSLRAEYARYVALKRRQRVRREEPED